MPDVSEKRLFVTPHGDIGYSLETPYRDGTTHVIFEPLDFIARLAALVPPPRLNLTRFHGVFAPNSPYRGRITPARRGRGAKPKTKTRAPAEERTPAERQAAMRAGRNASSVCFKSTWRLAQYVVARSRSSRASKIRRSSSESSGTWLARICPACGRKDRISAAHLAFLRCPFRPDKCKASAGITSCSPA
jgi:hypothetical protein